MEITTCAYLSSRATHAWMSRPSSWPTSRQASASPSTSSSTFLGFQAGTNNSGRTGLTAGPEMAESLKLAPSYLREEKRHLEHAFARHVREDGDRTLTEFLDHHAGGLTDLLELVNSHSAADCTDYVTTVLEVDSSSQRKIALDAAIVAAVAIRSVHPSAQSDPSSLELDLRKLLGGGIGLIDMPHTPAL